jgi:hypothetical protein
MKIESKLAYRLLPLILTACGGGGDGAGPAGSGGMTIACEGGPAVEGEDTGFFVCKGNTVHRPEIKTCPDRLPPSSRSCTQSGAPGAPTSPSSCSVDADCSAGPHGRCQSQSTGLASSSCHCAYGCTDDSQCKPDELCLCGGSIGKCVKTNCKSDADCGAGSYCLSHGIQSGCSSGVAFACSTPEDQCLLDSDCLASSSAPSWPVCGHDGSKRVCTKLFPCAGRPLQVDARPRVASLARLAWG